MWSRHARGNGEQATDGEADPSLGAPAGSGCGPDREGEHLFGEDSDEDDRRSHPAFSEDERIESKSRAGMVAAQNQRGAGSGSGPKLPVEMGGSLT